MGNSQYKDTGRAFHKDRIETLTDGVFAISMTLLVTGLDIPKLNGIVSSGTIDSIIFNLFPDFIHYFVAFVLLAIFWWASHMRSHYLESIDRKMSFLNIATLLFVGLIPFSTNLAGDFPLNTHAVIIFELNLFAIGFLSVLQWNYIFKNTSSIRSVPDFEVLVMSREEAYIFPILSSLAILLALMSIPWSVLVYFIAPVYMVLMWLKETKSLSIKQKASS